MESIWRSISAPAITGAITDEIDVIDCVDVYKRQTGDRALVFFDGSYRTSDPGPFPFAFTLGCLEIDLPLQMTGNP